MKKYLLLTAILLPSIAHSEGFEFHGYMRSGIGFSKENTDQACFSPAGSEFGKFRLGNECETYFELTFKNSNQVSKGKSFNQVFTLGYNTSGHRDFEPTIAAANGNLSDDNQINISLDRPAEYAVREAYVEFNGFLGEGVSAWAGKRFNQRNDIHMIDYYYDNNSGPGAGVNGIPLGFTKLNVSVTRNIPDKDGPAQTNADFRFKDMAVGPGSFELGYTYGFVGSKAHDGTDEDYARLDGHRVSLTYVLGLSNGFSKQVVQYGNSLFGGISDWGTSGLGQYGAWGSQSIVDKKDGSNDKVIDAREKSYTIRAFSHTVFKPIHNLSLGILALYQDVDFGDIDDRPNKKETLLGLRPVYHINKTYSVLLEIGHTDVENAFKSDDGKWLDSRLTKYTVAPSLAVAEGYWGRPQLRLFFTQANWNNNSKGKVGGATYADNTNGFSTGVQVEAWW